MEVRHKRSRLGGYPAYYLLGEKIGLYAGYAVTLYPLYRIECLKEIKEFLDCVTTILSDIHTGFNYLFPSGRCN